VIRFDNLKSVVKKVLKGRRRVESDRFVALRSHYLFASQFTTPGLEGAQEKGGVEGAGYGYDARCRPSRQRRQLLRHSSTALSAAVWSSMLALVERLWNA
jgi:hypothetical protein